MYVKKKLWFEVWLLGRQHSMFITLLKNYHIVVVRVVICWIRIWTLLWSGEFYLSSKFVDNVLYLVSHIVTVILRVIKQGRT